MIFVCNVHIAETQAHGHSVSVICLVQGHVRISDLGLAVELKEGQDKIKGYAGTPGESLTLTFTLMLYMARLSVIIRIINNNDHFQLEMKRFTTDITTVKIWSVPLHEFIL